VTVATKNAINALFELGCIAGPAGALACGGYGTGVRAARSISNRQRAARAVRSYPRTRGTTTGSSGLSGAGRPFQIIFPYSMERDRARGAGLGRLCRTAGSGPLTTSEARKMTESGGNRGYALPACRSRISSNRSKVMSLRTLSREPQVGSPFHSRCATGKQTALRDLVWAGTVVCQQLAEMTGSMRSPPARRPIHGRPCSPGGANRNCAAPTRARRQ
jgi:hypothetical protein